MSTKLPAEVQTKKVKSLPADLAKLADEMLKEKFGIEEVEPVKSRDRFPEEFGIDPRFFGVDVGFGSTASNGSSNIHNERNGRGIETRHDFQTRGYISRVEVAHPDEPTIMEGIYRLREQIPRIREMVIEASPDFAHYLARNERSFLMYDSIGRPPEGAYNVFGEFLGMQVVVSRGVRHAVITARHGF